MTLEEAILNDNWKEYQWYEIDDFCGMLIDVDDQYDNNVYRGYGIKNGILDIHTLPKEFYDNKEITIYNMGLLDRTFYEDLKEDTIFDKEYFYNIKLLGFCTVYQLDYNSFNHTRAQHLYFKSHNKKYQLSIYNTELIDEEIEEYIDIDKQYLHFEEVNEFKIPYEILQDNITIDFRLYNGIVQFDEIIDDAKKPYHLFSYFETDTPTYKLSDDIYIILEDNPFEDELFYIVFNEDELHFSTAYEFASLLLGEEKAKEYQSFSDAINKLETVIADR